MLLAELAARHHRLALDSNVLIYLLETAGPEADRAAEILDAIESNTVTGTMATVALTEILMGPARADDGATFELLATELSQREIAGSLYVSLNTVKTHTRAIYRKLGASSRRDALTRAIAIGLLAS